MTQARMRHGRAFPQPYTTPRSPFCGERGISDAHPSRSHPGRSAGSYPRSSMAGTSFPLSCNPLARRSKLQQLRRPCHTREKGGVDVPMSSP
jgi:hypothetical protein